MAYPSDIDLETTVVLFQPFVADTGAPPDVELTASRVIDPPTELLLISLELLLLARAKIHEELNIIPSLPFNGAGLHELAFQVQKISAALMKED